MDEQFDSGHQKRRKDAAFSAQNSVRNLLAQIAETASMTRER